MIEDARQRVRQLPQVCGVVSTIRQPDVQRSARLPHRVVVLLVHREGEHAWIGFEGERRAVAVVHVKIDDRVTLDAARLQVTDGDRHVVERTEAFAVARERVMKAATDMDSDSKL